MMSFWGRISPWLELGLNQVAVKVQFCSEKVPFFRSWLELDSNKTRRKVEKRSVNECFFFGDNKRGWCLNEQQLRCNYLAFILQLSRRFLVRMWQIKKSHRSRTIDFTSTAYSLIVIRLKIRNFNLLQI